jgi:hypothetical protein
MTLPIAMALMVGCGASTPVVQYSGIKKSQHVETKPLPERPDAKPIPKDKDWVVPLQASTCTVKKTGKVVETKDGILLSPEKAVRAKQWKVDAVNVRTLHDIDRGIWGHHRVVYEERIGQANRHIKTVSPSWWSENKGTIAWASGFLLGAAATIGIVYAVDEVKQ